MSDFVDIANSLGLGARKISMFLTAPNEPGVYLLFSSEGHLIYVGKADDLRTRLQAHTSDAEPNIIIKSFATYTVWKQAGTVSEAERLEGFYYDKYIEIYGRAPLGNINVPPRSLYNRSLTLRQSLDIIFGSTLKN